MPHVQLSGACSIHRHWEAFEPRVRRDGDRIVRTIQAYLAHGDRSVLVEVNVVEGYLRQHMIAQISVKKGKTIVGLSHASRPEKSEGVRFCLGWLAAQLIEENPGVEGEADNLGLSPHPFSPH